MCVQADAMDPSAQPVPKKRKKQHRMSRPKVLGRTLIPHDDAVLSSAPSEAHFQISSENRNHVLIEDILRDGQADPAYDVR